MALLKIVIDKSARSLLDYISRDEATGSAPPIHTNMAGRNTREMSKEFGVFRALRPNLKKAVGHLMITISPEDESKMNPLVWQRAIDIALEAHGVTDAPFAAWVHKDTDHTHCHIFFSRIRADGSVISDSHSYRKNEAAARQIERELGLTPPAPLPPEKQLGDRRALENAARRAERKGEKLDYAKIKLAIDAALEKGASTPEDLAEALEAAGYRADFTRRGHDQAAEIAGWRIADLAGGPDATTVKASAIHRDLAWSRVAERLAANRPAQAQAQAEPERAQTLADAARIALIELEAGATDADRLAARLEAAGVTIHYRRDDQGEITGWAWEVAGERAPASALDPRLGWGQVQMALREAQQRAGLAPQPLGGRPQRGHGLSPAARQAGEASLSRRLRAFGFRPLEAEGAALWSNKRGDQLRVLADRVELHPAPRADSARWDDRAVSAWVLSAKLTQGDRLSLVNAGELAPELRRALIESCAAEGVTIVELSEEIERERERLRALGVHLPALGLRAAPEAIADKLADGATEPAPATQAAPESPAPATAAAQPSPAGDGDDEEARGAALLARIRAARIAALALEGSQRLRQRAAELRKRVAELELQAEIDGDSELSLDERRMAARNECMGAAVAAARRDWDAAAAPGAPRFAPLLDAIKSREAALAAARAVPEPSRLADPLGRAAARRQAAIDKASADLEAARQRLKQLNARIYHDPVQRAALDRRAMAIYAGRHPVLAESEYLGDAVPRVEQAAKEAEQREREAQRQARVSAEIEAARQRLADQQQQRDQGDQDGEDDDTQRRYRMRGG